MWIWPGNPQEHALLETMNSSSPSVQLMKMKMKCVNDGIHHYTTTGEYLGCITTEVDNPTDVAIRDGKIFVLEWRHVKVFEKK